MPPDSPAVNASARPRTVAPVRIRELARRLDAQCGDDRAGGVVTGMSLASTAVQPGDLYAALPGARTHGARFIDEAVLAGAAAVLTDAAGRRTAEGCGVPVLEVADPRSVVGSTAAWVYGNPASSLTLIGVTGTQGKTTTTQLLFGALTAAGRRAAVIGTLGTRIADRAVSSALTTPEAPELHALLAVMREQQIEICAMEVSSHALVMGRVDGVTFDVAAFTNFGRDHLDFHGTVEEYFAAKAGLFQPERASCGLVNADDDVVASLATRTPLPVSTYSSQGRSASWRAVDVALTATGSHFTVAGAGGLRLPVKLRLTGDFNVSNALCALACVGEAGADASDLEEMAAGIGSLSAVSGRMEPVDRGQDFQVYVDYAHKPDAIGAMLHSVRRLTRGRVTIVLGAGGERDAGKRPLMGKVAAELADTVVVTDDNPRSEDPARIRAAIVAGASSSAGNRRATVHEIADRREAIAAALSAAQPGDTVVIAGKGHEAGQLIGRQRFPFDDRAIAEEVLDKLTAGGTP